MAPAREGSVHPVRPSGEGSSPQPWSQHSLGSATCGMQAADIGVGIMGKEGRQAVNNSDFGIGQFRCAARFLLSQHPSAVSAPNCNLHACKASLLTASPQGSKPNERNGSHVSP